MISIWPEIEVAEIHTGRWDIHYHYVLLSPIAEGNIKNEEKSKSLRIPSISPRSASFPLLVIR